MLSIFNGGACRKLKTNCLKSVNHAKQGGSSAVIKRAIHLFWISGYLPWIHRPANKYYQT